jgi:hypothetical protein
MLRGGLAMTRPSGAGWFAEMEDPCKMQEYCVIARLGERKCTNQLFVITRPKQTKHHNKPTKPQIKEKQTS